VKDEIKTVNRPGEEFESTILGNGIVNVKEVIDACRADRGYIPLHCRTGILPGKNSAGMRERRPGTENEAVGILNNTN
jgi:hypothetical protein